MCVDSFLCFNTTIVTDPFSFVLLISVTYIPINKYK